MGKGGCGIFAYVAPGSRPRRDVVETLLVGLERLEYRGYDSAGIAVDGCKADGAGDGEPAAKVARTEPSAEKAVIFRSQGKIAALRAHVAAEADARSLDK